MKKSKRINNLLTLTVVSVMTAFCLFSQTGCKNVINYLIPNNEQKILKLDLKNVERMVCSTKTELKGKHIVVYVPAGTDVTKLLAEAEVSKQATLFPITLRYLQEAFPQTDVLQLANYVNNTADIGALDKWFFSLYEQNPGFNIPPLVFPINFLSPVSFAVIGGQGGFEMYTVKVMYDDGTEPGTGLLPPGEVAEKNILTFTVPEYQTGTSIIGENRIDFTVKAGTEVRSLLPEITASEGAIVIPVTRGYLEPFCEEHGLDFLSVLSGFITASDREAYLRAVFAPLDISKIKVKIDKPIDFTNPVTFAVLGKDKAVKLYTAYCNTSTEKGYLENFAVTKFKNPALVNDGGIVIDQSAKTVTATLFYPVEYAGGKPDAFHLFCDVSFIGSSAVIEYKGTEYGLSEKIPLQADTPSSGIHSLGSTEAVLRIEQGGIKTDYSIRFIFKEDPDTIRSITDFRFEKFYNSGIKATAMAAIANDGHEGTISVTVMYDTPDKPEFLTPSFISAGKVSVNGAEQHSTVEHHDFRSSKVYLCTSKNGLYTRRYTVKVKFIKAESQQPALKSFKFPYNLNNELSQDAEGRIDEITGSVYVQVQYSGAQPPEMLIPEFAAIGDVTVNGLTQSSGFSKQNFKYTVYYKVTAADDPSVSKIYGVYVNFTFAADSGCELLSFSLLAAHNPSLTADIDVFISAYSNSLYAILPKSADLAHLKPSFTAKGRVTVDDIEQTSGADTVDFSAPVEYRVTSENGLYSKKYTVKLQKPGNIIYVDADAEGLNNGLTWEDAFINLGMALKAAESLPEDSIAEIWITKDYTANISDYEINRQIILRGGFNSGDVSADRRREENKTVFSSITFSSGREISGTMLFDSIEFKGSSDTVYGIRWESGTAGENTLTFENCNFTAESSLVSKDGGIGTFNLIKTKFDETSCCETELNGAVNITDCVFAGKTDLYTEGECTLEGSIIRGHGLVFKAQTLTLTQTEIEKDCSLETGDNGTIILSSVRSPFVRCYIKGGSGFNIKVESSNILEVYIASDIEPDTPAPIGEVIINTSYIKTVEAKANIIADSFKCTGVYTDKIGTGNNIKLPSHRVTINNAEIKGIVDTTCRKKYFSIPSGMTLQTDVDGLKAYILKCGAVSNDKKTLKSNILTGDTHYEYQPYYQDFTDLEVHGIQTVKNSAFKQCFVYGGDSIVFTDNTITGIRENSQIYDFQFVILKNPQTAGSCIDVKNIKASCGWFRGETNTLTARKVGIAAGNGFTRTEFYGYTKADIQECNFKDILPVRYIRGSTVYYAESFIVGGEEVRVTNNSFNYGCPVLIGAAENFDISGNNFSGGEKPPALAEVGNNGRTADQYFELTLWYPKTKTFSNTAFASLNLDAEHRLFKDILHGSGTEEPLTLKNCYFTNGLAVGREKVTVDACKFGKGDPLTNQELYNHASLNVYGKTDTIIKNLDIQYIEVHKTPLSLDTADPFGFIKNTEECSGNLKIINCKFYNFERAAVNLNGHRAPLDIVMGRNVFTYEVRCKLSEAGRNYDLIKLSYLNKADITGCVFNGEAKLHSSYGNLVSANGMKEFAFYDNSFDISSCNNLEYSDNSDYEDSPARISRCKFVDDVKIGSGSKKKNIILEKCTFTGADLNIKYSYSENTLPVLGDDYGVRIKDSFFSQNIHFNPGPDTHPAPRKGWCGPDHIIKYLPSRVYLENCDFTRSVKFYIDNFCHDIVGNRPCISGPTMLRFEYEKHGADSLKLPPKLGQALGGTVKTYEEVKTALSQMDGLFNTPICDVHSKCHHDVVFDGKLAAAVFLNSHKIMGTVNTH